MMIQAGGPHRQGHEPAALQAAAAPPPDQVHACLLAGGQDQLPDGSGPVGVAAAGGSAAPARPGGQAGVGMRGLGAGGGGHPGHVVQAASLQAQAERGHLPVPGVAGHRQRRQPQACNSSSSAKASCHLGWWCCWSGMWAAWRRWGRHPRTRAGTAASPPGPSLAHHRPRPTPPPGSWLPCPACPSTGGLPPRSPRRPWGSRYRPQSTPRGPAPGRPARPVGGAPAPSPTGWPARSDAAPGDAHPQPCGHRLTRLALARQPQPANIRQATCPLVLAGQGGEHILSELLQPPSAGRQLALTPSLAPLHPYLLERWAIRLAAYSA